MPQWSTACPDWESRIVEGRPLIPFAPLFRGEAEAARKVFGDLRIVDAPHSPTFSEVGRPWLFEFSDAIFGAYDPDSGRRLIREFFLLISKKNAKSTGAAAIMLTALMRNWRKSGEFSILAPTIEIANNSFFPARDMVREDAELHDICHVQEHYRTITNKMTGATLKVVAADDETVGGKKSIGVLIDELWLFGKRANAENMLREATGGRAARPEGFTIYLSTQSDDPPAGVFRKKLQYARLVRDGQIKNNRFLPVIYEFPQTMIDDGRCKDKRYWYITNPNLAASVDEEFLSDEMDQAQVGGPDSVRGFLAKHLNVEVGLSLRSDRWTGAEYWEACGDPKVTLEYIIDNCEMAVVGIDGGGLDDLLGLAVLGRHKITRDWLLWTHAWAHRSVLERRKEIAPSLFDFEADGDLTIVETIGDDVQQVADVVDQFEQAALLPDKIAVGVDQMGISEVVDELGRRGIAAERIGGVPQGWKLNNAIKTTERKLAGGTIKHSGSRLMAWCVGNAKAEPKGNAVTISKQTAGSAKIDPLMATFDAVVAMANNPESPTSYLESADLMVL